MRASDDEVERSSRSVRRRVSIGGGGNAWEYNITQTIRKEKNLITKKCTLIITK